MLQESSLEAPRIITFLDTGVLIAAARGPQESARRALEILQDSRREFISSVFLELETLPKAMYFRRVNEVEFYRSFFINSQQVPADELLVLSAQRLAAKYGLNGMDALHIAAAHALGADEFITTEKPTKPMYRVSEFKVIYLADAALVSP